MDHAKANETQTSAETDRIIAEELERLLDSPMFVRSPVLSRLLQFLVEHRLRGGRSSPKAYRDRGTGPERGFRPCGRQLSARHGRAVADAA
jgi:hypothetical protein